MPSRPRWTPSSSPPASERPLRRWTALLRTPQARTTPARTLRALRRAGRARPRRGDPARSAGTGTATRVAEAGARARRGRPRPTAARPGRRADTAGHRTAPLPTPRGACATPCGASTRAQPGPREPGDAALTRSRRGRRRRPQPRAGPELEAVGPPPVCLPDGKQVRDDRPRWRPVPATEPPQPILSEAADVTTAPAQARPGPRLASALPGEFGLATPSVRNASRNRCGRSSSRR